MKAIISGVTHPNFAILLRLIIGGIFILSAVSKLPHHTEFEAVVKDYDLLPNTLAEVYANILPWIELLIGVYVLFGILVRPAAAATLLLGISFLIANTSALDNGNNHCGNCFGETWTVPLGVAFALDILLLATAAFLLRLGDRSSIHLGRLLARLESSI